MVIRGLYGAQLERGLAQFPREQWLMLNFAEWVRDYQARLDQLTDFLGIHRFRQYPPLRLNPTPEAPRGHARRARPTSTGWSRATPTTSASSRSCPASTCRRGRPGGSRPGRWPRRAGRQVRPQVRGRLAIVSDAAAGPCPSRSPSSVCRRLPPARCTRCWSDTGTSPAAPPRSCTSSTTNASTGTTPTTPATSSARTKPRQRVAGDATPSYIWWPRRPGAHAPLQPRHAADRQLPRPDRARLLAVVDGAQAAARPTRASASPSRSSGSHACSTSSRRVTTSRGGAPGGDGRPRPVRRAAAARPRRSTTAPSG